MKNLQEWAEYYYSKGIFSYPSSNHFDFKNWNTIEKAKATFMSRNWKGSYLSGVLGQKGKRAIKVNVQGLDDYAVKVLVELILKKLLDDITYPWVIREINWIYIIVESENIAVSNNYSFGEVILLWQGHFPLPALANTVSFHFKGIPTIQPRHISNDRIFDSINTIKEYLSSIRRNQNTSTKFNALSVELSYLCSEKHLEEVNAKRLGLSIVEYRRFRKRDEKLLEDFKKKLKAENRFAKLKQYMKKLFETIALFILAPSFLFLTIWMFVSPDSFKDIFEPVILVVGIIFILYVGIMLIAPIYFISGSFTSAIKSSILRNILTILITVILVVILLAIVLYIGKYLGADNMDYNNVKLRPDHF